MASSLTRALLEEGQIDSPDHLPPNRRVWFDYANSSNQRGEELIDNLERNFTGPLTGKRVLDIGCGFGGCSIAAGRRGASVIGVDLSDRNLHLSKQNLKDTPDVNVRFAKIDITDDRCITELGHFDLIVVDNVIEHVNSPARLIAHAKLLLNPLGKLYVTAPNARSAQMVKAECHYSLLAASLLTPHLAEQLLNADSTGPFVPYEVSFYLDFRQYLELFQRYSLSADSLLPEMASQEDVDRIENDIREAVVDIKSRNWGEHKNLVIEASEKWLNDFEADLAFLRLSPAEVGKARIRGRIMRDYGYGLWYFVAQNSP
jgi:2-polyprenyl-3-methyl-5-hydroxy-6-metoxy-1,4-benzoquinol methylase